MGAQNIRQIISPLLTHQERNGLMTGSERTTNHFGRLRNVNTPLRLHSATELHIGQLRVVAQSLLGCLRQSRDRLDGVDTLGTLSDLFGAQLFRGTAHARLNAE